MATPTNTNTESTSSLIERTNKLLGGEFYDTGTGKQLKTFTPNTITSDSLRPSQNITLPNRPAPNFGNIQPEINASLVSAKQQREEANTRAVEEARKARDTGLKDILDVTELLGQSGKFQDKAFKQEGVDVFKSQVDDFTNQLEQEQQTLTRRLQSIEKNTEGKFGGALEQELRQTERESLSKQADLAVLQNSSLRKYDTARSIADRKVQMQLEPIKARLESLKFIYQENKDLFTKTEQRAYEEKIKVEDREYKTQEENKTKSNDYILNAIQNGASTALVQKAQNIFNQGGNSQEVAKLLGGYTMSPSEKLNLQLTKIKIQKESKELADLLATDSGSLRQLNTKELAKFNQTPQVKDIQNAIPFKKALSDYKNAIEKYGTGEVFSGKGTGTLDSAFMTLAGFTKDFYKLGTLDNGVERLIDLGIKKPGLFGRSSSRISSIGDQIAFVESLVKNSAEEISVTEYGNTVELQTLLGNALSSESSEITKITNEELLKLPFANQSNNEFFNSYK